MSDKPIIFSAPMVRALLKGRKTQTRRLPKFIWKDGANQNFTGWRPERVGPSHWQLVGGMGVGANIKTAYAPGDRLYVREACATWGRGPEREPVEFPVAYAADDPEWEGIKHDARTSKGDEWKIRPSIHMPRWASRLTLTVTDVRVQRLQEISEADARSEGVESLPDYWVREDAHIGGANGDFIPNQPPKAAFRDLWNSLHGPEAWDANPWVAAYTFSVQHGNIDMLAERAAQ